MDDYIDISIECGNSLLSELDLRVPTSLTVRELLQIITDRYKFEIQQLNPYLRNKQTGEVFASTSQLRGVKDGALLILESLE